MKTYGQFCPIAKAAEVFCERWNALIIRDLISGPKRFSDLQRGVPLMSPSLLSARLKGLAAEGILERRPAPGRGHLYELTPAGREFVPLVIALGVWGRRWTRRSLGPHEVDLGLLVFFVEDSADAGAFGGRRCLIEVEFTDQPAHKRRWWFLNEDGGCQLCLEDPGGGTDLWLATTLPDAIHLIRGDVGLATLLADDRLEALGEGWARNGLEAWLNLSDLARVEPAT